MSSSNYLLFFFLPFSLLSILSIYTNLWFSAPLTWLFLLSSHQSPLWQNFALLENHSLFPCCISLKLPSYHTHRQRLRFSSSWSGLDVSVHGPILSLTYTFSFIQRYLFLIFLIISQQYFFFWNSFYLSSVWLSLKICTNYPLTHIGSSLPTNILFLLFTHGNFKLFFLYIFDFLPPLDYSFIEFFCFIVIHFLFNF